MNNPRLAIRYAKSLVDLATEQNNLEEVNKDIRYLEDISKSNPDFVALLRSPVIPGDKKEKILHSVIEGRVSKLTSTFIKFLVSKNRAFNLTEIVSAFIDQYNIIKSIRRIKITTAEPMSAALQQDLIKQAAGGDDISKIELETIIDESIIGGFIMETEGRLIDGSIRRDLQDVRKQFLNNDYIHKLR